MKFVIDFKEKERKIKNLNKMNGVLIVYVSTIIIIFFFDLFHVH